MRDNFSLKTKETMAKRVGMLCSNPGCRKLTSGPRDDPAKALNLGVAAHITAASPDGPRFDPFLTSRERKSHTNALWLCQYCAKLIDNDDKHYDAALLNKWKILAEDSARLSVEGRAPYALARVSDSDLINFYARYFNRQDFQVPFSREGSMDAFDKTIEDTISAITTGRPGLEDGQTQGIGYLGNSVWRQRMEVIVSLLQWMRSHFAETLARKAEIDSNRIALNKIREPRLCEWMDTMRGQVLLLFAEVCKEAGVTPPVKLFSPEGSNPPTQTATQPAPATRPPVSARQKGEGYWVKTLVHDLRGIIVGISSAADMIRSGRKSELHHRYADDIIDLSSLANAILVNARFLSERTPSLQLSQCLFRPDIYVRALRLVHPLLRNRGFKSSEIHSPGFDAMPALLLDRYLFIQVLFNLLSNSIKFATASPTDFRVVVRGNWGPDGCKISVCDWGLGVDPTESEKIFEGSYKSKRSRFLEIRGQGIGLMVARKIVEAHGGTLSITAFHLPIEFTIWLPHSRAARHPVATSQ